MNRIRSIAFDSVSWLLAATLVYLGALRLVTEAPWPIRAFGYLLLLVLPFSLLRTVAASFGTSIDLAWLFLPALLAGFMTSHLAR